MKCPAKTATASPSYGSSCSRPPSPSCPHTPPKTSAGAGEETAFPNLPTARRQLQRARAPGSSPSSTFSARSSAASRPATQAAATRAMPLPAPLTPIATLCGALSAKCLCAISEAKSPLLSSVSAKLFCKDPYLKSVLSILPLALLPPL